MSTMSQSQDICPLCNDAINTDRSVITQKGIIKILEISSELQDGLKSKLKREQAPIPAHKACTTNYRRPSNIRKRKTESIVPGGDNGVEIKCSKVICRSEVKHFNVLSDCMFCGLQIDTEHEHKLNKARRNSTHSVETIDTLSSIKEKALSRNDTWGHQVLLRVHNFGDLVAVGAIYHHSCQVSFFMDRKYEGDKSKGRPSGSTDDDKARSFDKLIDCIDSSDVHQYSIKDLKTILQQHSSSDDECYSTKYLKMKIVEHYGDKLIVSNENGKDTIYTFLDKGNTILRENYNATGMSAEAIIDMAGTLIEDEIRTQTYDLSKYPKFTDLENSHADISPLLLRLLSHVIKSKTGQRRVISLAHGITSAARPRSFISPILLAISLYINTKLESRELVDILSSLSFADDYKEVQRLCDALLPTQEKEYDWEGALVNFALDNADINVRTLTGHNTWHALGGIASKTPAGEYVEPEIHRSTKIRCATDVGNFGEIPLKQYKKPAIRGLKNILIGPLSPPDRRPLGLKTAVKLDSMWLASYFFTDLGKCPSWSGFNQTICKGNFEMSKIDIIPFVNHNPTQPDTLYSALSFIQAASEKYKLDAVPVTFDQPLYIKAADIISSSSDLPNVFLRLGGFHLVMSYLGSVGYIMSQSGLKDIWETVYAPNSVNHMLTGHAYARALRAHMLTAASLVGHLLETKNGLNETLKNKLKHIHEMLQKDTYAIESLEQEEVVAQLCQVMDDLQEEEGMGSRTGKLWTEYIRMIRILLLFIRAERCGDWDMHLYCVANMIPVLHAGGHTAYAKSSRLYLDQMKKLPTRMNTETYKKYTSDGYWTIRRSNRFWSGNFTDQSIETILMRMLKSRGGLAHGRGVTSSTMAKMVHIIPQTVPICESLEVFSGIHSSSSDQHKDLRPSSIARDSLHYLKFKNYISQHSPFNYKTDYKNRLVCIATGIVAPVSANPDRAIALGETAANNITGQNYADVKLKRNDRVVSIGAASDSVEVRGGEVEIDPMSLFLRVTCVISKPQDMADHLTYEFSKYPPSLFDKGLMRKTAKHVLANVLKSNTTPRNGDIFTNPIYVIDGGHLLHHMEWPNNCTYAGIIDIYTHYVCRHYGEGSFVCFDGYEEGQMSTKYAEQSRRAGNNTAPDILFDLEMSATCSQQSFLCNKKNTTRLISFLITSLSANGMECQQATSDADSLICDSAIKLAETYESRPVVVVGNDTDLLVILIDRSCPNLFMHYQHAVIYSIQAITDALSDTVCDHLLVAHAITGCDTVSAMHKVGKRASIRELKAQDCTFLEIFKLENATHDQIAQAGERFVLHLYRAKKTCKSLDNWRHVAYLRFMKRKTKKNFTSFHLQNLPPTSAANKYRSYRVYYTVQQWLGRYLNPTDWGWQCSDGVLIPIYTDRPVASTSILNMISCGCKTGCGKKCSCRKAGLDCTLMCSTCMGQNCTNGSPIDDDIEIE